MQVFSESGQMTVVISVLATLRCLFANNRVNERYGDVTPIDVQRASLGTRRCFAVVLRAMVYHSRNSIAK